MLAGWTPRSLRFLTRQVDTAAGLGRSLPPLDSTNASWDPLLYFEYEDQYTLRTTYSAPYLQLIRELD